MSIKYKCAYEHVREDVDDKLKKEGIQQVLQTLTEREQKVLKARFWDELTLVQTGELFNVNAERIRQIQAKALRKLRHSQRIALLAKYGIEEAIECIEFRRIIEEEEKKRRLRRIEPSTKKTRVYIRVPHIYVEPVTEEEVLYEEICRSASKTPPDMVFLSWKAGVPVLAIKQEYRDRGWFLDYEKNPLVYEKWLDYLIKREGEDTPSLENQT